MARVLLGLGTNLGDRVDNLRRALEAVGAVGILQQVSSVYETEPVGYADQPRFLNAACELETELSPSELLVALKDIEQNLGRIATFRDGPRLIDLDILLYDDLQVDTLNLQIPHPRMHQRGFVLEPLAEIAPEVMHPTLGKTVRELWEALPAAEAVAPLRRRTRLAANRRWRLTGR